MTNALILGMLAMLMIGKATEYQWLFWITWWVATFLNAFASEKWR